MRQKKSWREKLADSKDLPKVVTITEKMSKAWGKGTIVVPAPREVDQIMKQVPKGKLVTINQIRHLVAERHGATIGCPLTVGIFARIAAGAAMEEEAEGKKRITPYWRTLKSGGQLNPKYPGGIEGQRIRLEEEGHRVVQKGKRHIVENHESALMRL